MQRVLLVGAGKISVLLCDTRGDATSAMSNIERQRAASASAGVFAVASAAEPDVILNSMRGLFTDRIFVGIMVIGLLGLASDLTFKYLHRWLLPWSPKTG